jgi:hypothetical protein
MIAFSDYRSVSLTLKGTGSLASCIRGMKSRVTAQCVFAGEPLNLQLDRAVRDFVSNIAYPSSGQGIAVGETYMPSLREERRAAQKMPKSYTEASSVFALAAATLDAFGSLKSIIR